MTDANHLQQALKLHDQWKFEAARQAYAQALRQEPADHQALYGMGLLLGQHMLRSSEALPFLEAAIGEQPRAFSYWRTYINMLIREGLVDMARSLIELARTRGMQQIALEQLEKDIALTQGLEAVEFLEAQAASLDVPPASAALRPEAQPVPAQLLKSLTRLLQARDFHQADELIAKALRAHGRSPLLWQAKINMELERGAHAAALEAADRAIAQLPEDADMFMLAGEIHLERKAPVQAEPALRRAVALRPDSCKAHELLGHALLAQGRVEESYPRLVQAMLLAPDSDTQAMMQMHLVNALYAGKQTQLCGQFLAMLPQQALNAKMYLACGDWMRKLGWNLQAEMAYRQALQLEPDMFLALVGLSLALAGDGARLAERETVLQRALALCSNEAERMLARSDLAYVLYAQERWDQALEVLETMLQETPDNPRGHRLRCLVLLERLDLAGLAAALENSLRHLPGDHDLMYIQALYWGRRGDVGQAMASYDEMLLKHPNSMGGHSARLLTQLHSPHASAAQVGQSCRAFGQLMRRLHGSRIPPEHQNERDPGKVLRIGLVSADLRGHAAAKFFLPTMRELAKRKDLECIAYCNNDLYDEVTREFMELLPQWRGVQDMPDDALAKMVHDDGIDILVDLSGHTKGHRLEVFARRPAPVQLTWIGNPGGTGLDTMDYIILSDQLLDGQAIREQLTENILRVPLAYVFDGGIHAEPVAPLPALRNGHLTFGSFNRLVKVNREVVQVWGLVLESLPTAKLVIGACEPSGPPPHLLEWLQDAGINLQRVRFAARTDFDGYLKAHHDIDICLDTFPFTGGVVTNHALWMGVPTLTLMGELLCGRQSAEVMARVGLADDFAARDVDGLLRLAAYWSDNLPRLAQVRGALREALGPLELRQADIVAQSVALGLRRAWERWCHGQEAADLRVSYDDLQMDPLPSLGL